MKTITIRAYCEQVLENLKREIERSFADGQDAFSKYSRSLFCVKSHIAELREFTYKYLFSDTEEEIDFFKNVKPVLLAQYYYYEALASYAAGKPFGDADRMKNYSHSFLSEIRIHYSKYLDFYTYCVSGSSNLDNIYFTRNSTMIGEPELDVRFSTKYDLILARFICNQHLEETIMSRIEVKPGTPELSTLKWTAKKTHLVELVYALHQAAAFNNGKAELKEIAKAFEVLFNTSLDNLYKKFQEISLRKINRTMFIDELKVKLEQKLDEKI